MKKLEELKVAITNFSPKEFARFRSWFIKETMRRAPKALP